MSGALFEEGDPAPARLALNNVREALVNADVDPRTKRVPVVALLATYRASDLIKKIGTRHLTVVQLNLNSYLNSISRLLRRTVFKLWHADLTSFEGEDAFLWRAVLVEAHLFARLPPAEWENPFSERGEYSSRGKWQISLAGGWLSRVVLFHPG